MGAFDKTIKFIKEIPVEELEKKMKEYGVNFVPNYKNMSLNELNKIVCDIKNNDKENWEKLSAKCNWEQMIPAKILCLYGHPKYW